MKKKFRLQKDLQVNEYLKAAWPEHLTHIIRARRNAPLVKVFFPMLGFLFSVVFAGGIVLAVEFVRRYEAFWTDSSGQIREDLLGIRNNIMNFIPLFWGIAIIIVGMTTVFWLFIGLGKAKQLLLEAEKLEIQGRLEYYLALVSNYETFETEAVSGEQSSSYAAKAMSDVKIDNSDSFLD